MFLCCGQLIGGKFIHALCFQGADQPAVCFRVIGCDGQRLHGVLIEQVIRIHLQLRKQNRILFYSIENPYIDAVTQLRVGKHHGYGLKNVERAVNQNNGNFQVEKVDGSFIVQIRLNCEN